MKNKGILFVSLMLAASVVCAQEAKTDTTDSYVKAITKRSANIVAALHSNDAVFNNNVQAVIVDQYYQLGRIHDTRNAQAKNIKGQKTELTADDKAIIQKLETEADHQLEQLHTSFLKKLSALCTPEQIDAIKNGMTYNVLNVTYTAYQDMLPALTEVQKKQILDWLTEAREHAMDAESSDKKHAWFGKYKGRINNYLSAAGIDMKKAEADWQVRIKERNNQKAKS